MTTPGERLRLLYELNQRLATLTEVEALVRFATERARALFNAEGCSLLLLDRDRHELFFPVSSNDPAHRDASRQLSRLRFPADRGIAGWVLSHNRAVAVTDATNDPRFYPGVDQETQMTTHAVLAAPLRSPSGNIGVLEVVNPPAEACSADDLEFLGALANDIAVAYEKADLYQRLRGEVIGLRQVCTVGGIALGMLGAVFALGALIVHVARVLPLSELPLRPGMMAGVVLLGTGGVLAGVGRGWFVKRAA